MSFIEINVQDESVIGKYKAKIEFLRLMKLYFNSNAFMKLYFNKERTPRNKIMNPQQTSDTVYITVQKSPKLTYTLRKPKLIITIIILL